MFRRFLVAGTALGLVLAGPQAWAGHGSWGGSSGGSSGGWYSSGGSWGGSSGGWYSSGGSWGGSSGGWYSSGGSHGGLFARLHARHHYRHHHRRVYYYSSGGSSGGWYSSGGSWGSSGGSSGGASIGSAYKYYQAPAQPAPKAAPAQPKSDAPADKGGDKSTSTATGSALLTVTVPEDAKVYVNNRLTKTPGTRRTYVSRGLVDGFDYTYEIRAEIERDGKTVTRSRVVNLRAGQRADVAIDFSQPQNEAETTLTVYVPEDAEVYLEGKKTSSRGKVRQFRTSMLKPGEKWEDYTVRVVWNRDGRKLTQERKITLEGGQVRELSFEFSNDVVAQAR